MGMNIELEVLISAVLWGFVQLVAAGQAAMLQRGATWALSARDGETQPLNPIPARFERNFRNYMESFSFFAAALLVAQAAGVHNVLTKWGAITYLSARLVYTALYLAGIPVARSLAWNIAAVGILAVIAAPFVPR